MNKKYLIPFVFTIFVLTSCGVDANKTATLTETTTNIETTTTSSTMETTTETLETTTTTVTPTTTKEKKEFYTYSSFIEEAFGIDTIIYNVDDTNPYGIDLTIYGSNISAIFYEPKNVSNPYTNLSFDEFYNDYEIAITYEDAKNRSACGFIAGDITPQGYLPLDNGIKEEDTYIRVSTGTYILATNGNYIGYIPNTFGSYHAIYYGCGYVSMEDVAAYLLAFGELPPNSNYGTSSYDRNECIETWGIYGRVNKANFSGDVNRYPYEPLLPNIMGEDSIYYTETDFGTTGSYKYKFYSRKEQTVNSYNNGEYIERNICRFVFVSDYDVKSIDERYVFYTYNHYNDFQEYLNYEGGWGLRFGCESAGNLPCSSRNDYDESFTPSTQYPSTIIRRFSEIV